jgi:hypothetical protein
MGRTNQTLLIWFLRQSYQILMETHPREHQPLSISHWMQFIASKWGVNEWWLIFHWIIFDLHQIVPSEEPKE